MTDDQVARDLVKLAVTRTERAVGSVLQLTDSTPAQFSILISVGANLIWAASDLMIESIEQKDGQKPTRDDAVGLIFKEILDAYGLDWGKKAKR